MSHPARDPRSGIDGRAIAATTRRGTSDFVMNLRRVAA